MKRTMELNQRMLGKTLKEYRNKQNLTQEEFAFSVGMSTSAYQQYEQGKRLPRLDTLYTICAFLNVSIDALLFADKNKEELNKDNRYTELLALALEMTPTELEQTIDFSKTLVKNRQKYRNAK